MSYDKFLGAEDTPVPWRAGSEGLLHCSKACAVLQTTLTSLSHLHREKLDRGEVGRLRSADKMPASSHIDAIYGRVMATIKFFKVWYRGITQTKCTGDVKE